MIAFANPQRRKKLVVPAWHANFLAIEPQIREQAEVAFRRAGSELKSELVSEVVANALVAYARLVKLGKEDIAYPTPLAQFAIRQVRAGRRVGTKFNCKDISASAVQRRYGLTVERLDQRDASSGAWRECLIEDRHAGPGEIAAARIDIADWFQKLARQKRKIAKTLARGESTTTAAHMYGLTAGRVSQLRKELKQSWDVFQGESI